MNTDETNHLEEHKSDKARIEFNDALINVAKCMIDSAKKFRYRLIEIQANEEDIRDLDEMIVELEELYNETVLKLGKA